MKVQTIRSLIESGTELILAQLVKSRLLLPTVLVGALAGTAYGQYLTANVCQPGDPIVASSANSPPSESVANAIDGTQAKYLNFDTKTPALTPSGFVVTPSVGATWVTGITIESANDAPERDPKHFTLEGSNDAGANWTSGNWTMIVDLTIPDFTARFQEQTFYFANYASYKSYRWTVLKTATDNGCCMQVAEVKLLGVSVPKNVVQPGDQIFASSANSPPSESVANAIDGTQAKYLNFDTKTPALTPSGFAVTPSVGATLINGIAIQSANDAPERDPKDFTIEGSNDDTITSYSSGTWTTIATFTGIPTFTSRFEYQTFLFANFTPYKHYRWTVQRTATDNGCCMQVAEVQLLGAGAPVNVFVPGDQIFASSANSPPSESVANAIDGTQAKYLNFDTKTPALTPSGFAATPSVGATVIIGLATESANDAPERDPKHVTIEGSNDDPLTSFTSGTWTMIADLTVPDFTARFQWQYNYFPNQVPYKHYRWTVLKTATDNGCCMQVAEVQLLAVTAKADCNKAAFVAPPVDTPVLSGSQAEFLVGVNGPWPLQWYTNGVPIAGATKTSFTTEPITAANAGINYSVAIVGCQTSAPVHTVIFTPSTVASIGISFVGGGANGAPTYMNPEDIAGVQQQAYWINATNQSGDNTSGAGNNLPDNLNDSSNNTSTITFSYQTSHTWGAGVGTDTPVQRMLNGLAGGKNLTEGDQVMAFHNVPSGSHALLIYSVSPPLQVQTVSYSVPGQATIYERILNSDEYKVAPGFYRATSTSSNAPDAGTFVRFDGVQPDANGDVTLTFNVLNDAERYTGVNGIQLVLNAPNPGNPPIITQQPQPTVVPSNGVATLTVVATGNNLTYQWRKDGKTLPNAGHVSGATTSTLTISSFSPADEGIYSVAVFNPAGSTISKNASVRISKYNIQDALAGYWKFDETSGTVAANSVAGGQPANVFGTASWVPGQVANSFAFDGNTFMTVTNYPKAVVGVAASAWVKLAPAGASADVAIIQNAQPNIYRVSGAGTHVIGQFEMTLSYDAGSGNLFPYAAIGIGPEIATVLGTVQVPQDNAWHNVAFTADGAQLRVFVDGHQSGAADYLGTISTPDIPYLSIGARLDVDTTTGDLVPNPGTLGPAFNPGGIDETALWTRALSLDEISKLYQAGKAHNPLTSIVETPPAGQPTLTITRGAGTITVTWDHGTLQTAPAIEGPWTDQPSATSPLTESTSGPEKFYRAHN